MKGIKMTKYCKIKVVIEWRKGNPAIFANIWAYIKPLKNGLYRIISNDRKGNIYAGVDKWNVKYRCFEDAG